LEKCFKILGQLRFSRSRGPAAQDRSGWWCRRRWEAGCSLPTTTFQGRTSRFRAADKSNAEGFARKDSYVVNGLVKKWEVRPWNVVVGNEQPASPASSAPPTRAIFAPLVARTTESQLPKYLEHFSKNVLPELRGVHGYLGATVSLRPRENEVEIVVETNWRSLESIRAFAGPDLEAAVVADEAARPASPASTSASVIPKSS